MSKQKLTLKRAQKLIKSAVARAEELECKMNISIVDNTGILLAFVRMDGAWLGSADISMRKAKTALLFNMPTGTIGKLSQPGQELYAIEHSNGGLITFPGGLPITLNGETIGAIGVSGSSVENDHDVATSGSVWN